MSKKMNAYTRTGDCGETCILGSRVDKSDWRIEAIGSVDELNACLGVAAAFSESADVSKILFELQNDLFSVGAELANANSIETTNGKIALLPQHVSRLEFLIDNLADRLPRQTKFIIPAGTKSATMLNLARTVARRCERVLVKLDRNSKINPELLRYANRLSSLLHILSRTENSRSSITENNPRYSYL